MLITGGVNLKRRSLKTPDVYSDTPDYAASARADAFRVATYNVENYLDATSPRGCVKSVESKAKVRESIRAINPDVLALQEVGSVDTLMELRDSLKAEGLDFPHCEHVTGSDADLHVAILSRFPFAARRPHTNDSFELNGQRFRVRRGFAEVDVQVNPGYQITLFAAHLKSRNAVPDGDAAGLRLGEAKLLRARHAWLENRLRPPAGGGGFQGWNQIGASAVSRAEQHAEQIERAPCQQNGGISVQFAIAKGGWPLKFSEPEFMPEKLEYLDCCKEPLLETVTRLHWSSHETESIRRCSHCGQHWFARVRKGVRPQGGDRDAEGNPEARLPYRAI